MTNTKDKPDCFGTILPDIDRLERNTPCKGKAFSVGVKSFGVSAQCHCVTPDTNLHKESPIVTASGSLATPPSGSLFPSPRGVEKA